MSLAQILERFPSELQPAIALLAETFREEFGVRRTDFDDLKGVVRELAEAQKRTENRLDELTQTVQELAHAQKRTENRLDALTQTVQELAHAQKRTELRVEELAEAQKRTEQRVEELAGAQKRTENRLEELVQTVKELTQAQKQTADELTKFRRAFESKIGGLGARWGMQTEEAFRQGMRAILEEVGFTTERFLEMDTEGDVFGDPDQIELDVVIKNGKVLVVEIKSALDKGAVHQFARKVKFYARKTGRHIDRKLIVASYVEPRAQETAKKLGVEVCTDVEELSAS